MAPFLFNSFADGPTMVLSPHQDTPLQFPSQQFHGASHNHLQAHSNSQFSLNGARYTPPLPKPRVPQATWNRGPLTPSRNLNPSRKRSRDDAVAEETVREESISAPTAPKPIYGEGMGFLNPQTGMAEKTAANAPVFSSPAVPQKSDSSVLQGRKLQRRDASPPGLTDITVATIEKKLRSSGQDEDNHRKSKLNHSFNSQEPLVDDFTHILGISWQRVESTDEDMAAAIRGWAKYIDNHFSTHIRDSKILLKHRGLNAYLVGGQTAATDVDMNGHGPVHTQQVYYLFNENLSEARLVARNWDACLQNLRSAPMMFEDNSIVRPTEWMPERIVEDKGVLVQSVNGDGANGMLGGGAGHGSNDEGMGMDIDS